MARPAGLVLQCYNIASVTRSRLFAALCLRVLAHKRTSPVVRKQHFEVVFFPPAHNQGCDFGPLVGATKKALHLKCFF